MSALIAGILESSLIVTVMLVVKATLLLFVAGAVTLALHRRNAAARHLVWTFAMVMLLVMPLAAWIVPAWRIPVLTRTSAAASAASVERPAGPVTPAQMMMDRAESADGVAGLPASNAGDDLVRSTLPVKLRADMTTGLLLIWVMGAGVVLAWLVLGRVALRVVQSRAQPLTGAGWEDARRDAAWLLEVRQPVRLYRSRSAAMPVTWGVLRPVVLLPEEAESWSEERRRVVLLHELSHVARRDCLTQLLAGVVCALYWFHPAVWYAARRMRVEREHACDDLVLSAGTPAPEYAAHLLELAQRFRAIYPAPMVALHMARPNQLEGRLLTVLSGPSGSRPPTRLTVSVAGLVTLLLALPLSALQPAIAAAQDATRERDDTAASETEIATTASEPTAQDSIIERDVAARGGETLVLDLRTGGTVEITSWDEDRVRVRARLAGPDWRESAVSVQRSASGVTVVARQDGERGSHETAHVFDIRVPRRFNVQLASAGGGLTIRDVEGTFRGSTGGGDIRLSQLAGEAQLVTGGGSIRVADSELNGRITTGAGQVSVLNVRGDLRAGSSGGATAVPDSRSTSGRQGATPAAEARGNITINGSDSIARIVRRQPAGRASYAITTRDGQAMLLLRDSTVVLQLTDRGLNEIVTSTSASAANDERSADEPLQGPPSILRTFLAGMLGGGVRVLLDHGIEYSLTDLREARFEHGRLVLESSRGDNVFEGVSLADRDLMASFSARDARTFANRVNAARNRLQR